MNQVVNIDELIQFSGIKPYLIKNLKKLKYDLNMIEHFETYEAINYIRKGMNYDKYLKEKYSNTENKNNHIQLEYMDILNLLQDIARENPSYSDFSTYLTDYSYSPQTSCYKDDKVKDSDIAPVTVITMHGSKGLEYDTVFLPGLNEGYVPQSKAKSIDSIEEERRVLYVAMTRARENLYLSYIRKNDTNRQPASRFLKEIGEIKDINK